MRRVAKRHEAIATARPFSIAVVGFADDFLYCCGTLCYIVDDSLRILDLHRSARDEVVVSIPGLLRVFLLESEQRNSGRFRVLYCNENIVSCLYTSRTPDAADYLIAFETRRVKILLTCELPDTEKIFVRHNSYFLYYGTYSEEDFQGHKKWSLRGYCFEKEEWFKQKVFLGDLNGSEIGSTVCFEIYDGYFYALSSQTNYDVEEVDWTSFYHCIRFPVDKPSKPFIEKTALDEQMWRRQHREGPIDDRWASLALKIDEANGDLKIVESRREFLFGAGRSQRTFYMTKLPFSKRETKGFIASPQSCTTTTNSNLGGSSNIGFNELYLNDGNFERHTLAALTNDRLALTLKPGDNPHWLPSQTRYPRNVHPGDDGYYIFSQTHLRYYNFSAKTFLDLIDDPLPAYPTTQRLRLRVGSRKLDSPARDCDELLIKEVSNPITGEILYGLNERYSSRPVTFWPPEQEPSSSVDKQWEDLHALMNPPSHLGNIEATGDDRSFIYATGGKNQPRAIIFVNFDPAINMGLKRWKEQNGSCQSGGDHEDGLQGNQSHEEDSSRGKGKELPEKAGGGQSLRFYETEIPLSDFWIDHNTTIGERWVWREPAMYRVINKGFEFAR